MLSDAMGIGDNNNECVISTVSTSENIIIMKAFSTQKGQIFGYF